MNGLQYGVIKELTSSNKKVQINNLNINNLIIDNREMCIK